jgi:hypothetical protein
MEAMAMNLHVENAMVIRLGYGQPLPVDGRNIVVVWMSQATNLARWGHLRRSREGIDVTLVAVVHSSNRFWRDRKSRQNHTPSLRGTTQLRRASPFRVADLEV